MPNANLLHIAHGGWCLQIFLHVHQAKEEQHSTPQDLTIEVFENNGILEAYIKYAQRLFSASFPEQLMHALQVLTIPQKVLHLTGFLPIYGPSISSGSMPSLHFCKLLAHGRKDCEQAKLIL